MVSGRARPYFPLMTLVDERFARTPRGRGRRARTAVFTAIEGTLLHQQTFDAGANRDAVRRLSASGVPVIPVSVMTLAEILPLTRELALDGPMILEAGGAIVRRVGGDWATEACGVAGDALLDVIREIEDRSGAQLTVYSVLDDRDAALVSGRSGEMLTGSVQRQFSEPFVIDSGALRDVEEAAATIGFSVRRGRRMLYLSRGCDEGSAFERVRGELRIDTTIGLGGSPVDVEFLSRVDIPIIVPKEDGEPDAEVLHALPHARVAAGPAPEGWAAAVDEVLRFVAVA
jgi:mannosyl-3-phosphoglycerate phosphatase